MNAAVTGWLCPHGVPMGQYCARCHGRRSLTALAWTVAMRGLLAILPTRDVECPERGCGGAR